MTLLGPTGLPISTPGAEILDVGPGVGGKLLVRETRVLDIPGLARFRFAPGTYLIIHEGDFDRMVAETAVRLGQA
jgi:hypothetical protein